MRSLSNAIRVLGLICLVLAVSVPMLSQTTTGRILGTVSDQSGAAVADAAVIITDTQRGTTRAVAADGSGEYAAPQLQPGVYKVKAEAKGFKAVERVNIVLEVAQDVRVDITLPTGEVSETPFVVVKYDFVLSNAKRHANGEMAFSEAGGASRGRS